MKNRVQIKGEVCIPPRIEFTKNNTPFLNLKVCTRFNYKKNDQLAEKRTYLDIKVFGRKASLLYDSLNVNQYVYIEGYLDSVRSDTGAREFITQIIGDKIAIIKDIV